MESIEQIIFSENESNEEDNKRICKNIFNDFNLKCYDAKKLDKLTQTLDTFNSNQFSDIINNQIYVLAYNKDNLFKIIYERCGKKETLIQYLNPIFYNAVYYENWIVVNYLLDNFELDFDYRGDFYGATFLSALLHGRNIDPNMIKVFFDRGAKVTEYVLTSASLNNLTFLMREGYITGETAFQYYLEKNHSSELIRRTEQDYIISFFEQILQEKTDLVDVLAGLVRKYRSEKRWIYY